MRLEADHGPMTGAADWAGWGRPRIEAGEATIDLLRHLARPSAARPWCPNRRLRRHLHPQHYRSAVDQGTVVTAPFYVWAMHARLGAEELGVRLDGRDGIATDGGAGLTATRDGERIALLAWSFDPFTQHPRRFTIRLAAASFPRRLRISQIDSVHSNPYHTYVRSRAAPGPVNNLTEAEPEVVRDERVSGPTVSFDLPPLAVALGSCCRSSPWERRLAGLDHVDPADRIVRRAGAGSGGPDRWPRSRRPRPGREPR